MKLANILFIASAVSFVAAYDVCAQTTATKTARATDKPLSPMTESQKIDFIKGATKDEMKNFITNASAEELTELADKLLKEAEKNPSNNEFLKKIVNFCQLVVEITGEKTEQSQKNLAQLQAQIDFQIKIVEQADKKIQEARKEKEEAKKQIAEADKKIAQAEKESQELADGFGN